MHFDPWRRWLNQIFRAAIQRKTPHHNDVASRFRPSLETLEDRLVPSATTVSSIARMTPTGQFTNASSVTYLITFADATTGLAASNLSLTGTAGAGLPSSDIGTPVTTDGGLEWSDTVTGLAGLNGTLMLNLDNDLGLSNSVTNAPFTGATYTLDTTSIGSLTQTQWTVGRSGFNGTLAVSGGTTPYSLTGQSGLPSGLTAVLSSNTISFTGTPSAAGTFPGGSVTVQDTASASVKQTFSITINPAPTVGSLTQTQWTVGQSGFTGTLAVTNGTSPYTLFSYSGLPTGLSATLSGSTVSFTGSPTTVGAFSSGSVTITDADGASGTQSFSITINAAPTIGNLTQTAWTVNQPGFTGTMAITGGTGPFSIFGIPTGLPTGLTAVVTGSTIGFTGTPNVTGPFDGSVTIADTAGAQITKTFSITINSSSLAVGSLTQTQWTINRAGFTGTLPISNGTAPFTVTASSGLPTGLSATISGSNVSFTGTPTAAGTFPSGSVTVKDSAGASVTQTFSITIIPAPTVGGLTQTQWTVNQPGFTGTLAVTNGTSPFTLFAYSGLPTGLSATLSGSTISFTATPSATGTFGSGSVTVIDADGASVTKTFSITINAAPTVGSLTQTQWTVGRAGFTGTLAITGGTSAFTLFSFSGLPTGLSATLSGSTISFTGTPSALGPFPSGSVTVKDLAGASVTQPFSITINPAPTIGSLTQTQWTVNQPGFTGTLAIGGTAPFTLTASSGLPTGLSATLSGSTISFTGTPSAAGAFGSGSVTITDAAGASVTQTFSITINAAPTIGSLTTAQGTKGATFAGTLAITGGTGAFSIVGSPTGLPTGLTAVLSGHTISFTGKPTATGAFASGSITIQDADGAQVTKTFTITIIAPSPPAITSASSATFTAGVKGSFQVTATGTPTITYKLVGAPSWLSINASTGLFTGTPPVGTPGSVQTLTFTIVASNGATPDAMKKFTLTILQPRRRGA
jgi:hypothetical protein